MNEILERLNAQVFFCPRCGQPVERRSCFDALRPVCTACGWIYFADPKVAAGVLVQSAAGVLLVQRGNEPGRGLWSIPAGFVDAGEDPAQAAARECLEETGLVVQIVSLADVISGREHERGADMVMVYLAQVICGSLQAGDDAQEARYFPLDALPPLAFRATRQALNLL